jgi:hypothetical protein
LEGVKFFGEIPDQKGLILVDLRARILMTVVVDERESTV